MSMTFQGYVRHVEHGFFVPPADLVHIEADQSGQRIGEHDERFVAVAGLEKSIQFFRMIVSHPSGEECAEYVIVSVYGPRVTEQDIGSTMPALTEFAANASVLFLVSDRQGWAEIKPESAEPAIAVAVASTKLRYGWDESIPILVKVGSLSYAVRESENGLWVADLAAV